MNFENLNRLNVIINILSGNLLPVSTRDTRISVVQGVYSIFGWLAAIAYLLTSIIGVFYVSKEKALQNSTVNIVVTAEVIVLVGHMHANKNLLRGLIEKLDNLLDLKNEALNSAVMTTIKPLEKPLRMYAILLLSSVVFWISLPLIKIFQKTEFYYEDYGIPAKFSEEPYSMRIFIAGVLFEIVGASSVILKKIALDIYTIYLIRLIISQYRYIRISLAFVLRNEDNTIRMTVSGKAKDFVDEELKKLVRHHTTVVEISVMLKKLLSVNIGLLYIDNVFRFCFLGYMIITLPPDYFEKSLLVMYAMGALAQLFILCFCVEQLFEASVKLTDDAFYETWYTYDVSVQQILLFLTFANKLECKLSAFGSIDLTLASFMSIMNQAYSACLLFLQAR